MVFKFWIINEEFLILLFLHYLNKANLIIYGKNKDWSTHNK
jgi:hypothetical protein